MSVETSAGRREANKTRTREALVQAAMALAEADGLQALTVDRVAEAAGISRRTFFNYFAGLDAVIAHSTVSTLEDFRDELRRRPPEEPLLDGALAGVDAFFTVETLTGAVRGWRLLDAHPGAYRFALQSTGELVVELASDWVETRGGDIGPGAFQVQVLTEALMAAFEVARRAWLDGHPGVIDAAARRDFVAVVAEAFECLRPAVEAAVPVLDDRSGSAKPEDPADSLR